MTVVEGDFGFAKVEWSKWRELLRHMGNLVSDAVSYQEGIAALRAENAALKGRVNELVSVVKEQEVALDERAAKIADYEAQKQEMLVDVATVGAALEKASDAYVSSHRQSLGDDNTDRLAAPGNDVKRAALIDAILALVALAERASVPRRGMLFLLSFLIKFTEMPDGKMNDFMEYFTGERDEPVRGAGNRQRNTSEMAIQCRIAACYAFLKASGLTATDAKIAVAKACGLMESQHRKILDFSRRVGDATGEHWHRLYREAHEALKTIVRDTECTSQAAVKRYLKAMFEQDPALLPYIQKSKNKTP